MFVSTHSFKGQLEREIEAWRAVLREEERGSVYSVQLSHRHTGLMTRQKLCLHGVN